MGHICLQRAISLDMSHICVQRLIVCGYGAYLQTMAHIRRYAAYLRTTDHHPETMRRCLWIWSLGGDTQDRVVWYSGDRKGKNHVPPCSRRVLQRQRLVGRSVP